MKFEDVLGNGPSIAFLRRALSAGRLPHAMVFQGPPGVGKSTVARLVAGAILCEAGPAEGPCGRCAACLKREHGNHSDYFVVTRLPKKGTGVPAENSEPDPDDEGDGGPGRGEFRPFIVVEQVREIVERAAFPPREGAARVFLIDPADRMNPQAQNALLKTLEEPPSRAVFLLVAARPHALLSTVRSRCLAVRFSAMGVTELAGLLESKGMARGEAITRAALAGGRPGAALSLDPERLKGRREEILTALEGMSRGIRGFAALPQATGALGIADEHEFLEGLDLLEGLLRDAAVAGAGASSKLLVHADLATRVHELGQRIGARRAAELVRGVERVRSDLRFHINKTLAVEALFAAVSGGPIP